jgi:nucleoside-triphosphatase THEP1
VSEVDLQAREQRRVSGAASSAELTSSDAGTAAIAHREQGKNVCVVGPYVFDENTLQWGRSVLDMARSSGLDFLIIDEVGPLEIRRNGGFEPAVQRLFDLRTSTETRIVAVVRESLLKEFASKYGVLADDICGFESFFIHRVQTST